MTRNCPWLAAVLALGIGACSSGSQSPKPDTGVSDAPVDMGNDSPTGTDTADDSPADVPTTNDGGVPDGPAPTDGPGVECAPRPTGTTPSGTAPMQDAGPTVATTATRPELAQAVADSDYTIAKVLAQGFNINNGVVPDGGVGPVTYMDPTPDTFDPQTNGIGDPATFTPTFTVAADGSGTHTDFNTVFTQANAMMGCGRVYIRVMPGTYRASVLVPSKGSAPWITLYSTDPDASKTVIINNAATATAGSMTLSATMRILAVRGFQMKNMTVANDYVEDSVTGNQTAVAVLVQSDRAQFENVRFLGNIGTLYVKSTSETIAARSYFRDCYVEGDQDFITGRGVAVFDHTEVHSLTSRVATGGSIAYPSTLVFNHYGFLFDSCKFTADAGATGVFLGRQWPESSDNAMGMSVGKMIVRNSTLGAHLAGAAPWSSTGARTTTPKDPTGTTPVVLYTSDDYFPAGVGPAPAEPFLGEYRNSGPGAHQ
jgi:pectinesterase